MIKFISKDFKDARLGNKQVVKVCKGSNVVWEFVSLGKLVYSNTGKKTYYECVDNWSGILKPNKDYRFVTNLPSDTYQILDDSYGTYKIKNYDIFKFRGIQRNVLFENTNENTYDIKIYEADEEATIII